MSKLSSTQRMALAEAYVDRIHGLEKTRAGWLPRKGINGYAANTIQSLIDRGYMRLYAKGTVAHVTELGQEAHRRLRREEMGG